MRVVGGGNDQLHYVFTDHLGSIVRTVLETGPFTSEQNFDAWGRRRNPTTWAYSNPGTRPDWLIRGFTGHEQLDVFNLIHMNARLYDPLLSRMLSPDNYVVDPDATQAYNRYSYCLNNPLKYVDPDGNEPITVAIIIGAAIGAYMGGTLANGSYNPGNWNFSSGRTWGFMAGGALVGGLSGGASAWIAKSGVAFANTHAIIVGSAISSTGTYMYSGGQTDLSLSVGVASVSMGRNGMTLGYLGKKGNSLLQNLGYGFGAMANVQDLFAGNNGGSVDVYARKKLAGHSWIEGDNINISVGPAIDNKTHLGTSTLDDLIWEAQYLKKVKGANFVTDYNTNRVINTKIINVNLKKLQKMTNNLNSELSLNGRHSLSYGVWNGCVNQTSRALMYSGVFNFNAFLPITAPVLLNTELVIRNYGMMFSHYMTLNP